VPGNPSPKAIRLRNRMGVMARQGVPTTDPRYIKTQNDFQAQVVVDRIERLLTKAPPLGPEHRARLAELVEALPGPVSLADTKATTVAARSERFSTLEGLEK
jgi:hypothetical protein